MISESLLVFGSTLISLILYSLFFFLLSSDKAFKFERKSFRFAFLAALIFTILSIPSSLINLTTYLNLLLVVVVFLAGWFSVKVIYNEGWMKCFLFLILTNIIVKWIIFLITAILLMPSIIHIFN